MKVWQRMSCCVLALAGNSMVYGSSGWHPLGRVHEVPLLPADAWIAFTPHAIWLYLSFFPLIWWAFLKAPGAVARCLTWLIPGMSSLAAVLFWLYPTRIEQAQQCDASSLSNLVCAMLQRIDTPLNCLPSLHAAISVLCVAALWQGASRWMRSVYLGWAVLICWSAVALRQHLSLDIFAGLVLGGLVVWLMRKRLSEGLAAS